MELGRGHWFATGKQENQSKRSRQKANPKTGRGLKTRRQKQLSKDGKI